jgi:hypothetical protein
VIKQIINVIFFNEDKDEVVDLLKNECADNLPFLENNKPEEMERFRFAVIKLSEGQIDKLYDAIELSQSDWRDLLVAAGFGDDISAHELWANEILKNAFLK